MKLGDVCVAIMLCLALFALSVWYNRSFTCSNGGSYSLPLRPDIVVETSDGLYVFDAKFRPGLLTGTKKPKNGIIPFRMTTFASQVQISV